MTPDEFDARLAAAEPTEADVRLHNHQHHRTVDGLDRGDLLIVCSVCGRVLERIPDTSPWVTDEMIHTQPDDE